MPDTYTVWRRLNDGYVASSANGEPFAGGTGPDDTKPTRFETLLVTDDWPTALRRIANERTAAGEPWCPECGGGPTRQTPAEPAGWLCDRCGEVWS